MPCLNLTFAGTNSAVLCVPLQNIAATVVYVPCKRDLSLANKLSELLL